MEQGRESSSPVRLEGPAERLDRPPEPLDGPPGWLEGSPVRPLVRPVRPPSPPAADAAPARSGPAAWYRDRRVQVGGAVLLGVLVGAVPGLTLAAAALMESQAADKRAVAAEEAVRLWQQQASDDSRGSPTPAAESPGLQPATGPAATEEPTAGASPRRTSARPRAKRVAGDGVYRVGKDMEPGTWQSKGNNRCHWERLRGTKSGEPLMVGYGNPFGDAIVTIRSTDDTFKSANCNDWSRIG